MMKQKKSKKLDIATVRKVFERCKEQEDHNRTTALEDLKFARLGEQWPEKVRKQREKDNRPCLTINKLPAFRRQVVNEARQNKPAIKVRPNDSFADVKTAEVFNGLIRNIEAISNASVAYDTATECAIDCGFGYWRISVDYAHNDAFEQDITIDRVRNPFAVYGDPDSMAADSSDWMKAFVVDRMTKEAFREKYPEADKDPDDFQSEDWNEDQTWCDETHVLVAEYWERKEYDCFVIKYSNGLVLKDEEAAEHDELQMMLANGAVQEVQRRPSKSFRVTQHIVTGSEVIRSNPWPGQYIPISVVYGDEFDIEGKRYLRSLIHESKDAQRNFNYWRTTATELIALAPRVPFIGKVGAFDTDADKWETINTHSHSHIEYDGEVQPQRQPLDVGPAGGALQEALNASDDMKAIMGMYDASLGARSNETSGKAIMARQREGDVSTFHFLDNMMRAIQHTGRILIDLIPKVYSQERIVRVLGEDGKEKTVPINQKYPVGQSQDGQLQFAMHDMTRGKYDLVVDSGPSYTTKREETANQMLELIRAQPNLFPLIGDLFVKSLDWPDAEKIAERLAAANGNGIPPQLKQQMQKMQQALQKLQQENASLKGDKSIEQQKVGIDQFEADTDRMKVLHDMNQPELPL